MDVLNLIIVREVSIRMRFDRSNLAATDLVRLCTCNKSLYRAYGGPMMSNVITDDIPHNTMIRAALCFETYRQSLSSMVSMHLRFGLGPAATGAKKSKCTTTWSSMYS